MTSDYFWDEGEECECCGCHYPALQKDHIVPRREGGTNEPSNLWYICPNCHALKTSEEQSRGSKGRVLSEEHKRKISEAQTHKPRPEDVRRRISEAQKGRPVSDEKKKRISESLKGRTQPDEVNRRRSETLKARFRREDDLERQIAKLEAELGLEIRNENK